jgi:hypothetical protein
MTDESSNKSFTALMRVIDAYEPLTGAPYETDKRAHFLNEMAKHAPYKTIPANLCVRAVNGLSRTPAPNAETVVQFMKGISAVRKKLLKLYNRDLYIVPGVGVRASVDESDRIRRHQDLKNRAASATAKAIEHAATVQVEKIKNPTLRAAFSESRKALLASGDAVNRMQKILQLGPKAEEK